MSQLKVLKQRKNDSCGYYVLFNALLFLAAIGSSSTARARDFLQLARSRAYFWRFFQDMRAFLVAHARALNHGWYPWNETIIRNGILERPHMDHVLNVHPHFKDLKFRPEVPAEFAISVIFDFSKAALVNAPLDVKKLTELSDIFSRFRTMQNYTHAFLIGQTVHWITLVINKIGDKFETVVCDSRNILVLDRSDEDIEKVVQEIIDSNGLRSLPEYRIRNWTISLQDIKFTASMLHRAAIGDIDLRIEIPKFFMDGFFDSYRSHVLDNQKVSFDKVDAIEFSQKKFSQWLKDIYPPAVIENHIALSITEFGLQNLPERSKIDLIEWTKHLRRLVDFRSTEDEIVERFKRTLQWFQTELDLNF